MCLLEYYPCLNTGTKLQARPPKTIAESLGHDLNRMLSFSDVNKGGKIKSL